MRTDFIQAASSPLARTLLLSVSLHLAVLMLIRPEPGQGHPSVSIIQARLLPPAPVPEPDIPSPAEVQAAAPEAPETRLETATAPPETPVPDSPPMDAPAPALNGHPEPSPQTEVPAPQASPHLPEVAQARSETDPQTTPAFQEPEALVTVPVLVDTRWYTARELDVQPRAGRPITPEYPEAAQKEGLTGYVVLSMKIDEFGQVRDVTVESAEPAGMFDESALAAFRQARFYPARLAGRPVRSEIRIRVTYALED